jgi:hypothetical protein
MDKWLEIPKDRKRQPVVLLCLLLALAILLLFTLWGGKKIDLAAVGFLVISWI